MKRLLAALAALIVLASPVSAAPQSSTGSITINEPPPYHAFGTVTLTVTWSKLKGYEYPVVLYWCGHLPDGGKQWFYFRRWDVEPGNPEAGPQPVPLPAEAWPECTFELWAYNGTHPAIEHVISVGPTIEVLP